MKISEWLWMAALILSAPHLEKDFADTLAWLCIGGGWIAYFFWKNK